MNTHMFGTKSSPRVGLVKLVPVTARFEGPTWDNLASYHVNQKGSWRWYEFPLWLGKSYGESASTCPNSHKNGLFSNLFSSFHI